MHCNDLIIEIGATYGSLDERLQRNYRKEFEPYSPAKLERVWEAIQENHYTGKPPEVWQVFKYMNLVGISRFKPQGNSYLECLTCGTFYSVNSHLCPKCNKNLPVGKYHHNEVKVHITEKFPDNFIFVRPACSICPIYRRKVSTPNGIKCESWGTDDNKSGLGCDSCKCFDCCIDRGEKNPHMPSGSLMKVILDRKAPIDDPAWRNIYKKLPIEPGYIFKHCGKTYRNKTGKYTGLSPKSDLKNWERYTPKKSANEPKNDFKPFKSGSTEDKQESDVKL